MYFWHLKSLPLPWHRGGREFKTYFSNLWTDYKSKLSRRTTKYTSVKWGKKEPLIRLGHPPLPARPHGLDFFTRLTAFIITGLFWKFWKDTEFDHNKLQRCFCSVDFKSPKMSLFYHIRHKKKTKIFRGINENDFRIVSNIVSCLFFT